MTNNNQISKTGLSLFHDKLTEQGFKISEVDTSQGDSNGMVEITNPQGKTTKQNIKNLAEIYGNLTWYHFTPEQAILEIVELIIIQINYPTTKNEKNNK